MSKNLEDQDKIEQKCLDNVRSKLSRNVCYGVYDENYEELKKLLSDAKPNKNSSTFPDFLFENGFIEHFAVTSSFENKKGSVQKLESSRLNKDSEKNFLKELEDSEDGVVINRSYTRLFEEHTHSNIVNSIQKNWKKHIISYDNYSSSCKHGIFLIEYRDRNIQTAICREDEPADIFESYKISADKYLLKWIYHYKNKIEYLIFINPISIEIIRLEQILEIIKNIPNVKFAPIIGMESLTYIGGKINK
ncbi:hypothetical protein [Rossellomorea marisflavi]|uniref:hypothetical protein n=1 Tax=Rossellomorea marisflavi TaxID=189381 RepID=UPI003D2F1DAC